ncbi:MAG: nucleotidyltransferase domain-containing protein [Candidatus Omnitrophota bacterium]|nr:nucleotidyltransferase domain-containing protein [Candidatus Omnitrophota bacterium]
MLLNSPLNNILGQYSKVKILRFLVKSQAQLNGREIAKNVGLSHVKAHTALKDLTKHGVVNMRSVGSSLVYWLNEEHFLVKEIIRPAFEKEEGVFEHIARIVLKAIIPPRPLSIILFGSFARGNAEADSDIDIVIMYPHSKNKSLLSKELSEAEKKVTSLFGNQLSCVPLAIDGFQRKLKAKDKFINEIVRTGKVIYGKNISELTSLNDKKD